MTLMPKRARNQIPLSLTPTTRQLVLLLCFYSQRFSCSSDNVLVIISISKLPMCPESLNRFKKSPIPQLGSAY